MAWGLNAIMSMKAPNAVPFSSRGNARLEGLRDSGPPLSPGELPHELSAFLQLPSAEVTADPTQISAVSKVPRSK